MSSEPKSITITNSTFSRKENSIQTIQKILKKRNGEPVEGEAPMINIETPCSSPRVLRNIARVLKVEAGLADEKVKKMCGPDEISNPESLAIARAEAKIYRKISSLFETSTFSAEE